MKHLPAAALSLLCALSVLSCSMELDRSGSTSKSTARSVVSGTNGSITVSGMTSNALTVSYSPGSEKNYARLYVSEGNGTGLVLASQNMTYSSGTYSYTLTNSTFTSGAAIYVCVLVNDGGTEKCVPQGTLSDTTSWAQITYGSDSSTDSNGIVSGGTYKVIAECSGKALDVDGWSTSDGANVQQWTWGEQDNQKWIITSTGDGYYSIINKYSGLGLDVADWSTSSGGNIQQWSYGGQDNQKWTIEELSDGYYKITNKYSSKVMDVSSSSTSDGANVQQWTWNESSAQRWALTYLTSSSSGSSDEDDTVTDGATDGTSVTGSASSYTASDTTWDTIVWSDEFEGTSLKTANWTYDTGTGTNGWGNSELETYTTSNATVHGGVLDITADSSLNSSRIKSSGLKTFKYGKIVARIKSSQGTGSWPAFWMLGTSSDSWPYQGEIDIFEHANSDTFTYQTCHWNSSGTSTSTTYSHASWGQTTNNNYWNDISSLDVTEWHTYAIEWTSSIIEFYVDDTKVMAMDIGDSSNGTDTFNYPFYIIFNFAMGGQFPNVYSSSSFTNLPWHMYVDYVRVYQ